jgi:DNA-binding GntR family transcriptional regulator
MTAHRLGADGTKADEIAAALEEAIAVGSIPPGTVLRQDHLSQQFEVSRTPVREALRKLAALGLATFEPNRGVRVVHLDRSEWQQAFQVRSALEGLAAELAAERIGAADLAELEAAEKRFAGCTEMLRSAIGARRRQRVSFEWAEANYDFHDVILRAAQAPLIERLARSVRRTFSGQSLWRPESELDRQYELMVRQHRGIRECLAAGMGPAARAASAEHALDSWRLLELVLDEGARVSEP